MNTTRTTETVQKSIAAFFRENRRMPSYAEMINLLGVKSKSVVNFWVNKLINAGIIEKDNKGHLTFTKASFGLPMVQYKQVSHLLKKKHYVTSYPWMNISSPGLNRHSY